MRLPLCVLAIAASLGSGTAANAQFTPPPQLPSSAGNIHTSSPHAVLDIGTRFLRHLGTEAARPSAGPPHKFTPSGGGADLDGTPQAAAQTGDRYRAWFEAYGLRTRMDPRGDFAGDTRRIVGGVAGLGMRLAPGFSVGVSVDQSRTDVDIAPLAQSAKIDLSQLGGNAAIESGPWTLGIAGLYGFGDVDSQRGAGTPSLARYDTRLWGALTELSYYWSSGPWRVVPKIGADWVRAKSDAFVETGGTQPIFGSDQIAERARIFGGAEIGYTWLVNETMMDLSVYGRGVDMVARHPGGLTIVPVTPGPLPRFLAGVAEDRLGVDAGAAFAVRLSSNARLYAIYDARFCGNFESHAGTLGLEMRW